MSAEILSAAQTPVLSVGDLTEQIKGVLEWTFTDVWVAARSRTCRAPIRPLLPDDEYDRVDTGRDVRAMPPGIRFELEDGLE